MTASTIECRSKQPPEGIDPLSRETEIGEYVWRGNGTGRIDRDNDIRAAEEDRPFLRIRERTLPRQSRIHVATRQCAQWISTIRLISNAIAHTPPEEKLVKMISSVVPVLDKDS